MTWCPANSSSRKGALESRARIRGYSGDQNVAHSEFMTIREANQTPNKATKEKYRIAHSHIGLPVSIAL